MAEGDYLCSEEEVRRLDLLGVLRARTPGSRTNTLLVLLGGTPYPEGLEEVGAAYGVEEGVDFLAGIEEPSLQVDVAALQEKLPALSLAELAETASRVARERLEEARIVFVRLAGFADDFDVVLQKAAGVQGGLGLGTLPRPSADPGPQALCVLALAGSPDDLESVSAFLAEIEPRADLFAALRGLIEALPSDLAPLLLPRQLEAAKKRNPRRVAAFGEALRSYLEAHPDQREILLSETYMR